MPTEMEILTNRLDGAACEECGTGYRLEDVGEEGWRLEGDEDGWHLYWTVCCPHCWAYATI